MCIRVPGCDVPIKDKYELFSRTSSDTPYPSAAFLAKYPSDMEIASGTEEARLFNQFISSCLLKVRSGKPLFGSSLLNPFITVTCNRNIHINFTVIYRNMAKPSGLLSYLKYKIHI